MYLASLLHNLGFRQFRLVALLLADRVITFMCFAKQSAQTADTCISMSESKVVYCLAPAFFSKSTPYCSLPFFSTSCNASLRSSEYSKALRKFSTSWDSCSSRVLEGSCLLKGHFLHNRNVADTKSPYPIKRLEVIRWFNQNSMAFNQSLS